jgi:hypothetical protein
MVAGVQNSHPDNSLTSVMVDIPIFISDAVRGLLGFFKAQIENIPFLVVIYPYLIRWKLSAQRDQLLIEGNGVHICLLRACMLSGRESTRLWSQNRLDYLDRPQ